ncbi:hypothetical protein EVAR_71859_1 [Eumeta japonica]|uniref:Uncharacterized protein n=1 Tax=Eumeta variegata TaxID=151549 RepID=A0A4C1SH01_EUMVA|nr:hypothetical protein EVAR_71859_1 [Eumeta japonica]
MSTRSGFNDSTAPWSCETSTTAPEKCARRRLPGRGCSWPSRSSTFALETTSIASARRVFAPRARRRVCGRRPVNRPAPRPSPAPEDDNHVLQDRRSVIEGLVLLRVVPDLQPVPRHDAARIGGIDTGEESE